MTVVAAPVPEVRARPAVVPGLGNRFLQRYGTLLILLALCLVFTIIGPWRTTRDACNLWQQVTSLSLVKNGQVCAPVFASQVNILNLVRQVSVIGIVALGEMLVILTGGIDLGVGSIVGFAGVVAATLQRDNAGLYRRDKGQRAAIRRYAGRAGWPARRDAGLHQCPADHRPQGRLPHDRHGLRRRHPTADRDLRGGDRGDRRPARTHQLRTRHLCHRRQR
ncbi:MAG: ABC transporter permease, partial [Chloroflexi bacterium]